MKSLKEIHKKLKPIPFEKDDRNFMGNYLKYLGDNKIKFRFDPRLKEEGLINSYEECNELGMIVIACEQMESSWAFVKSKKNYSILLCDWHEGTWSVQAESDNFQEIFKPLHAIVKPHIEFFKDD